MHWIKTYLGYLHSLFYPNLCIGCGKHLVGNEEWVCVVCLSQLPDTNFINTKDSLTEQRLWGRVKFNHATSIYYFSKNNIIQHLLHALKYKQITDLGILLGKRMGTQLLMASWIKDIDLLLPVPLSAKRMYERGYNQSTYLAEGINQILNIPIMIDGVQRIKNTESQTNKTRTERIVNMRNAFEVTTPELIQNKHILIVDDVLTTGATIESLCECLHAKAQCTISIATLACAVE